MNYTASDGFPTALTPQNDPGIAVETLHWTYWSYNGNDGYAITTNSWSGLANPRKLYTFLCAIQQTPAAQCGSTGALPPPE